MLPPDVPYSPLSPKPTVEVTWSLAATTRRRSPPKRVYQRRSLCITQRREATREMLLQQLASLPPGAVACVAAVVVREVVSVSLVREDGKRVEAVEFEVCDATARLRAVATDAGYVAALRAAVGSPCVLLHVSLCPVGDPLCLRLVLRPSCAVVPVEDPLTSGEEHDLVWSVPRWGARAHTHTHAHTAGRPVLPRNRGTQEDACGGAKGVVGAERCGRDGGQRR